MELIWTSETTNMSIEEFKDEMLTYSELVVRHSIKFVLNDNRRTDFVLVPEIQKWIADIIYPKTVQSLKKIAFLMQENFIQQLATQQMVYEWEFIHGKDKLKSKYFVDPIEAKKWLNISEGVRSAN
jgi:hypothetical protein